MNIVREYIPLLKTTYDEWDRHQAPKLGAALAYYTVLALAPLLIVVIAVVGMVLGKEAARGEIVGQIGGMVGTDGAKAIETVITNANKPATGIVATVLGLITLFVGASGVFSELRDSLNRIWETTPKTAAGIWGQIRERFLSFGMVLAIGFLLLVSLAISAGLTAAGKFAGGLLPVPAFVMQGVNLIVSVGFITVLFALIFRFLPDEKIDWGDVWLGAFVTALLFTLGKFAIGLYLGKASIGSAYGAAGSLVIVLVWVYYSAQIFFFGAEFTHVYAQEHGSLRNKSADKPAQVVTLPIERLQQNAARIAQETQDKEGREPAPSAAAPAPATPAAAERNYVHPPHNPDSVLGRSAVRAASLVVIAALGGLGWWRNRGDRHLADR
jgi:membrane protein